MKEFLSFLPEFILWGSAIWFWIFTFLLIGIFFVSDLVENGITALFSFIIFFIITYFWSNFNIFSFLTLWNVLIYLGIGLVYAAIRTLFFGRKKRAELKESSDDSVGRSETIKRFALMDLKNNVFRWWLLFPVSMINWAFTDLIKDLYNLVYSKIGNIFVKIFDLGFTDKK